MFEKLKESLKEVKKAIKAFKGVKSMVMLKCDNCNSISVQLCKSTLSTEIVESEKRKFNKITYGIACHKCKSLGVIDEYWERK